jgi:hypothetical protein
VILPSAILPPSPSQVDLPTMGPLLDKFVLTPVALAGRVTLGMLAAWLTGTHPPGTPAGGNS